MRNGKLHPLIWLVFPPIMVVVLGIASLVRPELAETMLSRDEYANGIVERLTWILLVPGIAAGVVVLLKHRTGLPRRVGPWIAIWVLGATYFALEEMSWGQWVFGWESPELFQKINSKGETNFHNTSKWLNRRPRVLLEFWIMGPGILLPIWSFLKGKPSLPVDDWRRWVFPSNLCLVSALTFLTVWIGHVVHWETIGHAELKEYTIAVFISMYLLTSWAQARAVGEGKPAG